LQVASFSSAGAVPQPRRLSLSQQRSHADQVWLPCADFKLPRRRYTIAMGGPQARVTIERHSSRWEA